jgi:hypothetical protein
LAQEVQVLLFQVPQEVQAALVAEALVAAEADGNTEVKQKSQVAK